MTDIEIISEKCSNSKSPFKLQILVRASVISYKSSMRWLL